MVSAFVVWLCDWADARQLFDIVYWTGAALFLHWLCADPATARQGCEDKSKEKTAMNITLEPVPPPKEALIEQIAETIGLVRGLRVEKNRSACRCGICSAWIRIGEALVWIPDFIGHDAPHEAITEAARKMAYNGMWSGCCVKCAPKYSRKERIACGLPVQNRWWEFWK